MMDVQSVIDGKEELVTEQELLSTHPLNLEKTRFTMSKKSTFSKLRYNCLFHYRAETTIHG